MDKTSTLTYLFLHNWIHPLIYFFFLTHICWYLVSVGTLPGSRTIDGKDIDNDYGWGCSLEIQGFYLCLESKQRPKSTIQNWRGKFRSTNCICVWKESIVYKSPRLKCHWCLGKEANVAVLAWEIKRNVPETISWGTSKSQNENYRFTFRYHGSFWRFWGRRERETWLNLYFKDLPGHNVETSLQRISVQA